MRTGVIVVLLVGLVASLAGPERTAAGAGADIRLPLLSEARLRTAANFSSPALAVLPAGTVVEVLSRDGPYFQVAAADTIGFVVFVSVPQDPRLASVPASRQDAEIGSPVSAERGAELGVGAVPRGVLDRDPAAARVSRDEAGSTSLDQVAGGAFQPPDAGVPEAERASNNSPAAALAAPVWADPPAPPPPQPVPTETPAPVPAPAAVSGTDLLEERAAAATPPPAPLAETFAADAAAPAFQGLDTTWTAEDRAAELLAQYGEPDASRILRGDVWIGMTAGMVLDARGDPERVHRTVTGDLVHEMWVYDAIYVYVDDEVVIGWQESARPAD